MKLNTKITQTKIPSNWVWATIGEIGVVTSGGTPSTRQIEFWNGEISWITPADLSNYKKKYIDKGQRSITQIGLDNSSAKILPKGSVLFSSRAPIGYTAIAKNDIATNQGFKNVVITESGYSDYIYYYLLSSKQLAESFASGTTFKELSAEKFKEIPIPFPPIEEQYRIVEKIEEIFSELDKAEEGFLNAQKHLEIYKQVVLNDAFEGKLTKKWRKGYNLKDKFIEVPLKECCNLITDGTHYSPKTVSQGFPYITVSDIEKDKINFEYSKQISQRDFLKLKKEGNNPKFNDILFSKDGTVGKVSLIDFDKEFAVLSSLAILRPNINIIIPKYLFYSLKSASFLKQALESKKGVAIRRVVLRDLKELFLKITNVIEQKQIVLEIEYHLTLIDNLQKSIFDNLQRIEVFRQSIYKKAFSGKLVPQIENEESTISLLRRIKKEKRIYETKQKEVAKKRIKIRKPMESKKTARELLEEANGKPINAKDLWQKSKHKDDIENFYEELKELSNEGLIVDKKEGKNSKIFLINEN